MLKIPPEDREMFRALIRDFDRKIGSNLSSEEGKRRLQEGILEMFTPNYYCGIRTTLFERKEERFHNANGLLLTKNGYFLTCYHCVTDLGDMRILDSQGRTYSIEGVCVQSKGLDVAIVKARVIGPREHINYKYAGAVVIGQYATLLARRNSRLEIKGANIRHGLMGNTENQYMFLNCDKVTAPGDSGGILTNTDGEIMSLHSGTGSIVIERTNKRESEVSISTPFSYVIKLLRQVCG